jgi:MFS family permease
MGDDATQPTGVLADNRFARLAAARTISVLGNGFGRVALAFGVLSLPGATPVRLSIVLACQALPQLAFVLVAGVIGDRMSRYRVMVGAELLGGAAWTAIALMILTRHAPLPALAVAAAVAGLASALFLPAMSGVVPEFISGARLQAANALLRVGQNAAMVLGLALSGLVVAVLGPGWALAINAGSFFVSALLIAGMRLPHQLRPTSGSSLSDLRHGWSEFISRQWLWVVVVQSAFVLAAIMATVGVLGPLTSREHPDGARAWALLIAAQSLGTVAGAGLATRVRTRRPIRLAVLATFPSALPMVTLGLHAPWWVTALAMFGCGVAADIFGILWSTTMQREIPLAALSRVSAYDLFGSLAFAPLGLLIAGPVAAAFGAERTLLWCAAFVVGATLVALLSPSVRSLSAPDAQTVALPPAPDSAMAKVAQGG